MRSLALASLLALAACDPVSYVEMTPKGAVLGRRGETASLRAIAMTHQQLQKADVDWKWATKDPAVATVDQHGTVTAVGDGMATITATAEGVTGELRVEVRTVKSLKVDPTEVKLELDGARVKPAVLALDARGNPLPRKPFLVSANDKIANVDGDGGIWPVAEGATTVSVRVDEVEQKIAVTVAKAAKGAKRK